MNVHVQMWDTHVLTDGIVKLCNLDVTQNDKSIDNNKNVTN